MRRALLLLGGLALGLLGAAAAFMLGMRARSPRLLTAVRRFNRAVTNPYQRKTAGNPGAYAALLRHTGRRSGKSYETPVGAVPTGDGFVIALVYGTETDWLKNVLAAGSATIVHEGRTYQVDRPEVVPLTAVEEHISPGDRRGHRMINIDRCLRVRLADG